MAFDWLSISTTVAASAAGTGLAAFILRSSVSHIFSKDLESFRSSLSRSLFEYQTKFAWLHTERSKVLVELYRLLSRLDNSFTDMLRPIQPGGDEHRSKMRANAINAMTEFFEFFDANKVFFDEKLVKQTKSIQEEYRMVWATFVPASEFHSTGGEWAEAWDKLGRDVMPLRAEIENAVARMLEISPETVFRSQI